jgi:hypothetical protein
MWLFLSARLRSWLLFALVLPLVGRLLQAVGVRVAPRNARAGQLLTQAGGLAQGGRRRRRRRRR